MLAEIEECALMYGPVVVNADLDRANADLSLALELRYGIDPLIAINVILGLHEGGRGMKEGETLIADPFQLGSILAKSEGRDSHQQRTKHHCSIIMSWTFIACCGMSASRRWASLVAGAFSADRTDK